MITCAFRFVYMAPFFVVTLDLPHLCWKSVFAFLTHFLAGNVQPRKVLRPGDKAPCDGIVIEGRAFCDEALISGEARLIEKTLDQWVLEGSTVAEGFCALRVLEVGEGTTLAKIRRLVEEAQMEPPTIQRVADRIAQIFVPCVLLVALLTEIVWAILVATDQVRRVCKYIAARVYRGQEWPRERLVQGSKYLSFFCL